MRIPLPLLILALLALVSAGRAAEDSVIAAVRAADDERIAATVAGDRARLEAIYSDALHYAHSNGKVDTKSSQIQGVTAGPNKYERFEHKERQFIPTAPGVVLMHGHVLIDIGNRQSGQKRTLDLTYLAVWRQENGRWRFMAWQSCPTPAAAPPPRKG